MLSKFSSIPELLAIDFLAVEQCLETIYSFLGIKFLIPKFNAQRRINLKGKLVAAQNDSYLGQFFSD